MMSSCDRWNTVKTHFLQRSLLSAGTVLADWALWTDWTPGPALSWPGECTAVQCVHRTCLSSWTTFPSDNCTVGDCTCSLWYYQWSWSLIKPSPCITHDRNRDQCVSCIASRSHASLLQNGFIKSDKSPPSLHRQHRAGSAPGISRTPQLCQIFLVNIKCFFIPNIFGIYSIKYLLWYLPTRMSFCLFCPLHSFEDQKISVGFIIVWLHEPEAGSRFIV